MSPGIACAGMTAGEEDKVARLTTDIRDRFSAGRVVGCRAVGIGRRRALCFTRADGRIVACVVASEFLAADDEDAVALLTSFYA